MHEPEELQLQPEETDEIAQPPKAEELSGAFSALSYFVAISLLLVVGISVGAFNHISAAPAGAVVLSVGDSEETGKAVIENSIDPFEYLELTARAAIVLDATTGEILYERNANDRLPLASLTKIMTVMLAREQHEPSEAVEISETALVPEGDQGLLANDTWRLGALASLTLVSSSNDGAEALAENDDRETFIAMMNRRAEDLGLSNTYFFNPTGLDVSERVGGSYGSAHDVAKLLIAAVRNTPDIFEHTTKSSYSTYSLYGPYEVDNTNEQAENLPGLIASKTGFTDLAGGNLAILFDAGLAQPVAVVVMGSDLEKRIDEAYMLAHATREFLAAK